MWVKRKIGPKGQIVVPKDIRDYLGLKSGSGVILELRGRELVLKPEVEPEKFVEEFLSVPRKLKRKIDLKKLYEEQLEEKHEVRGR